MISFRNTLVYIYMRLQVTCKILFRIFDLRHKIRNFVDDSFIIREINWRTKIKKIQRFFSKPEWKRIHRLNATPRIYSVNGEGGNDFWSGKISWKRKVLYLVRPFPRPLANFTSIFSSFCFSFRPTPCPSTDPRAIIGQCQYLVTGIYRRDATRRQPSPVYSPVASPSYSSSTTSSPPLLHSFRPLSTSW